MQNRESKRATICGVSFMTVAESTVTHVPGIPQIQVIGTWDKQNYSSVEFYETLSSDNFSYDVNLTVTYSDSSYGNTVDLLTWLGIYILVRLDYTDGTCRVVGTDQFPVVLGLSGEGSPRSLRLSYKGNQPELSKFL